MSGTTNWYFSLSNQFFKKVGSTPKLCSSAPWSLFYLAICLGGLSSSLHCCTVFQCMAAPCLIHPVPLRWTTEGIFTLTTENSAVVKKVCIHHWHLCRCKCRMSDHQWGCCVHVFDNEYGTVTSGSCADILPFILRGMVFSRCMRLVFS